MCRFRLLFLLVSIVCLFVASLLLPTGESLTAFRDWVACQGLGGVVLYCLVFALCTVLLVPGLVLTIGAGVIYGPIWGTAIASIGALLGATAAFLIARYAARDPMQDWLQRRRRFAAVDEAISERGWWLVFLLRLSPFFPFTFINYMLGLSGVRLATYVSATWVGILPGTLLYVLAGYAGAQTLHGGSQVIYWSIATVGTAAAAVLITRLAARGIRNAVRQQAGGNKGGNLSEKEAACSTA